jgi:hypothetical protein
MVEYAARWHVHFKDLDSEPRHVAVPNILRHFLGQPAGSSLVYRKWLAWEHLTGDEYDITEGSSFRPFDVCSDEPCPMLSCCDPSPEFGCAYFGLESILGDWLENREMPLDVNKQNASGQTLLGLAARAGSLSLCDLLIRKGAAVNPEPESHSSPLPNAAHHGHLEVARLLIQHGANVSTGGQFDAPIMEVKVLRDIRFMQLLLENRADPNTVRGEELTDAEWEQKWRAWSTFLGHRPVPKKRKRKRSPLILAAYYGLQEAVQLLLDWSADVNLRVDGKFPTALYAASLDVEWTHQDVAADLCGLLIAAGANADVVGVVHGSVLGAAIAEQSTPWRRCTR